MLHDVHRRRRMLVTALAAAASTALAPATAAADAGGCPGARAQISDASPHKLRSALLCLVNRRRAEHGLSRLTLDRKLERAAGRHARDMAERGYFAHQRAGGPDLGTRLVRAGWRGSRSGEAIAYGCGAAGSPNATLEAWMNSPPHRAVILSGSYGRGGLGIGDHAPCGGGATWVLDVGRR
jgi:uncharacterized protein YkwD